MQAFHHHRQAVLLVLAVAALVLVCGPAPIASAATHAVACPVWATGSPTAPGAGPAIAADGAPLVGAQSASLSATITAAGDSTDVTAVYSSDGTIFTCAALQTTTQGKVEFSLTGLRSSTPYQVWFAGSNSSGSTVTEPQSFSTLAAGIVAQGVMIGAVRAGGKTTAALLATLQRPFTAPLRFTYLGAHWHVAPSKLGLRTNAARLLATAADALPGQKLPALKLSVDSTRLRAYVNSLSRRWGRLPAVPAVRLAGTNAVVVQARSGVTVETTRMLSEIEHQLLSGERARLQLAVRTGPSPGGAVQKAVVVRLANQTLTAYLNGKAVLVTPVTTGRPALPTPIGSYSVQSRASPYVFHSPWAPGSPYWYPPTPVTWAMEFYDGDFLHDDPGEPANAFGQDSQNGYFASHGCVHVPHAAMAFLYGWLPVGAPVIVAER